jgi:hypothetical protein
MLEKPKDPGYHAFRILQAGLILFLLLSSVLSWMNPELYFSSRKWALIFASAEVVLSIGLILMPWIFSYLLSLLFLITIGFLPLDKGHMLPFLSGFFFSLTAFALGRLSQKYLPP